jgi:hypothetical protein
MEETYSISLSCHEYLSSIGHQEITLLSKIQSIWDFVVGNDISKNAFPIKIEADTLFLLISNSSWTTHLNFISFTILDKLKTEIEIENPTLFINEKIGGSPTTKTETGADKYKHQPVFPTKIKTIVKH